RTFSQSVRCSIPRKPWPFLLDLLELPHGQLQDEDAAGSGKVMPPERTPMQVGDSARESEPQAEAASVLAQLNEGIEQLLRLPLGETAAGVLHLEHHMLVGSGSRAHSHRSLLGELDPVVDEVPER